MSVAGLHILDCTRVGHFQYATTMIDWKSLSIPLVLRRDPRAARLSTDSKGAFVKIILLQSDKHQFEDHITHMLAQTVLTMFIEQLSAKDM